MKLQIKLSADHKTFSFGALIPIQLGCCKWRKYLEIGNDLQVCELAVHNCEVHR
jgi:hypothetical protein